MRIAYVSLPGPGNTDRFVAALAQALEKAGLRLAGCVQTNRDRPGRTKCDMDLRVLPDGPVIRISEDRGALAQACRLDPGALEQAVLEAGRRLDGADCLIVNKFGKREAEGKGLVPLIAEALERGLPVLVGVNGLNLPQLHAFAGDAATALPADLAAAADWCLAGRLADAG